MARNVTQYDLLISCPGDITAELPLIEKAVAEFNKTFSDTLGISVRTKHWSKNAYSQSGDKPQTLLNEQFVNDCDAAIALFWTRFGTPTDEYGSGTEEEIEIMLNAGKQVFMYFSDKPVPPSTHNAPEYAKVIAFKEKYKDRGIYFTYISDDEFYRLCYAHLTQFFITKKQLAEIQVDRKPSLSLKGIDGNGVLCNYAYYQSFLLNTNRTFYNDRENIKTMFSEIASIHIPHYDIPLKQLYLAFNTPVKLEQNLIDIIKETAAALCIELPEDFFCIGNLSTQSNAISAFGNITYNGTDDEKKKYSLLQKLYQSILDACCWGDIEKSYSNIMCIKLALTNDGTSFDEDIDVTIKIKCEHYQTIDDISTLSEDAMRYMTRECSMSDLLSIPKTVAFEDYSSSAKNTYQPSISPSGVDIWGHSDYEEDYRDELSEIFCYDIFSDGEYYIIKIKFDYIKHNTTIAFPTAILLKGKPDIIEYTIKSKNSTEAVEAVLNVN